MKTRGLTLIELVVAIGILGIFASFLFAAVNPLEQFKKASDSGRKSDLAQIQRAIESFNQDHGKYPDSTSSYKIDSDPGVGIVEVEWGGTFAPYIDVLPKDAAKRSYVYYSTGQAYYLYASLERGNKDTQVCKADGASCDNVPIGASCGTGFVCNYGASSPNVSP